MKLIMENWRGFLKEELSQHSKFENNVTLTKGIESVGGHEVESNTFSLQGGKLVVWKNSPFAQGAHSIFSFSVDESRRGQGIGSKLIDAVIKNYHGEEISGQVSSLASLKVFFNKGFVPTGGQVSNFDQLAKMFDENYGSLNMRLNKNV